jgi:hypothetical protein
MPTYAGLLVTVSSRLAELEYTKQVSTVQCTYMHWLAELPALPQT